MTMMMNVQETAAAAAVSITLHHRKCVPLKY